ncbi:MAG: ATP-dependent Clp protease ATP-binding subunit [Bacteroidales bacterium]|nr:ATP-dependent Clp protease ATP-binding subunit [Bacteroidales bacterium]MBP5374334.1 ATP-dependent Clp protease ATP-binding subunit [Bacteroidales bacterium]
MQLQVSDDLNDVIKYAREEAMRTGSYGIGPDHLFLGIIRHEDNVAFRLLQSLGVEPADIKTFIDQRIFTNETIPYEHIDQINFSRQAQNVLSITIMEAARLKSPTAMPQHLLLALIRTSESYGQAYLRARGLDYGRLLAAMEDEGLLRPSDQQQAAPDADPQPAQGPDEDPQEKKLDIEEFAYDLTRAAREGKLDPVVGREDEISRVIQILGRRKKNNPMLIGEPGVGKSAIVEGIAQRIATGSISAALAKKRILSLDIASVVAGTKYRGDFEKRLKTIIKEASENPDIILFIDEFHTIVGAGGASGSLDAANMLKPALARGEFQCIGATTLDEFTKIVEKDGALDRRFQKIVVNPADVPQSIGILKQLRHRYEEYHGVSYTDAAIEAAVRLTDRYISDKSLPDKAIDALDEAGSMVRLSISRKKADAVVDEEDIASVVSKMTGIPVNKVAESEGNRIIKMRERLSRRIIGQDEAVETVVRAIQRNRAGLKDPNRPIGTFLFFGPTGVGKTQLARTLAEYLFDSEDNMVRLDMSEYMEKFSVSRLIGAPPGYVGYEEGGQLSERVRRKPYCVVLLDEIEKAHPDIFNLLLQVMDDGRLTDSNGRTVDFKNTLVIMTSNVGSREVEEYGSGIGFATASRSVQADRRAVLEKAVKKAFPPEFVNRVDAQVYFHSLDREALGKIIDIELKDLRARALEAGYKLSITPQARRFVADAGYDPAFGARPLRRAIMRYVEDPVSEFIIADRVLRSGKGADVCTLKVSLAPDKESTVVTKVPAQPQTPDQGRK